MRQFSKTGQGATEYLVLLAVVLIIALVGIAILGFFPGMASDAQMTESQTYWKSAYPLSVVETSGAIYWEDWGYPGWKEHNFVIRIRNNGGYRIQLTKMLGRNMSLSTVMHCTPGGCSQTNMTGLPALSPGEEICFASMDTPEADAPAACKVWRFYYLSTDLSGSGGLGGTLTAVYPICNQDGTGIMSIDRFGFEYLEYVEGQQITKRQVGTKPLLIKCVGAFPQ